MGLGIWYCKVHLKNLKTLYALQQELIEIKEEKNIKVAQKKAQYIYEDSRLLKEMILSNAAFLDQLVMLLPSEKAIQLMASHHFLKILKTSKDPKGYLKSVELKHSDLAVTQTCKGLLAMVHAYAKQERAKNNIEEALKQAHEKRVASDRQFRASVAIYTRHVDQSYLNQIFQADPPQKGCEGDAQCLNTTENFYTTNSLTSHHNMFKNKNVCFEQPKVNQKYIESSKAKKIGSQTLSHSTSHYLDKQLQIAHHVLRQGNHRRSDCRCPCADYRHERYLVWSPPYPLSDEQIEEHLDVVNLLGVTY